MTAKEVIESTKKEIERIKTKKNGLQTGKWYEGFSFVIKKLSAFMDSFNSVINTPSNIEKAAEEYANESLACKFPTTDEGIILSDIIYAFKQGAQWMAEQGETFENTVVENYDGLLLNDEIYVSSKKFSKMDKVIVQIRKK